MVVESMTEPLDDAREEFLGLLGTIDDALSQAQDCINQETPEEITVAEANEDTISKIREAMRVVDALRPAPVTQCERVVTLSETDIEYLKTHFSYDAETGVVSRIKTNMHNGKLGPITSTDSDGYLVCRIGSDKQAAHRVAWLLNYGAWPAGQIDHINGVKTDNRLSNLREVNQSQNNWNCVLRKDNTSGYKGVYAAKGKFGARIKQFGKYKHLGTFDTAEEAHRAYCDEARKLFGEYANDGSGPIPVSPRSEAGREEVQDTFFVDSRLPIMAMSGDIESDRVLKLHFRRKVSDDDRKRLLEVLNAGEAALSPDPGTVAVASAGRGTP